MAQKHLHEGLLASKDDYELSVSLPTKQKDTAGNTADALWLCSKLHEIGASAAYFEVLNTIASGTINQKMFEVSNQRGLDCGILG